MKELIFLNSDSNNRGLIDLYSVHLRRLPLFFFILDKTATPNTGRFCVASCSSLWGTFYGTAPSCRFLLPAGLPVYT